MTDFLKRNVPLKHPRLPFVIGAVAFLIYALTLNHGLSLRGLSLTAQMTGWTWQPKSDQPLLTLACLPLQCLPAAWLPLALNLMSALTAALTLTVLARSVQLLPLNRLRIQRMFVRNSLGLFSRHDSWVPVVMAAVVGGLDLGFWQEATSASGEMLDVLLLAMSIWCLLEHRQTENDRWLDRAAIVWGVGMAENWTMQLSLPLFFGALIWLRGFNNVRVQFLGRMAILSLSAFWGILLLSLANNLLLHVRGATGQLLDESLRGLSQSVFPAHLGFWMRHPLFTLLVLLYFLLAALPMSLHLKREGSYHISMQARMQLLIFEFLYAVCLVGSLWLALEPNGGPQAMLAQRFGSLPPLLSLVYLNALGAGYYTAHFLLIFGADWESIRRHDARFRPPPFMPEWLRRILPPVLTILPAILLLALGARNFWTVEAVNRSPLQQYGELVAKSLPVGGGVILSDDSQRLWVLQTVLAQRPDRDRWAMVNPDWLLRPEYRTALEHKWPLGWQTARTADLLTPRQVTSLLCQVADTNPVFYLHPSFGHFIEGLDAVPRGLAFQLTRKPESTADIETRRRAIIDENTLFWDSTCAAAMSMPGEKSYAATITPQPVSLRSFQLVALAPIHSHQAELLGIWLSVAIDDWGAWLQQAGNTAAARQRFEKALALYPQNPAAAFHLQGKTNLSAMDIKIPAEFFTQGNDSARAMPGSMVGFSLDREIDDAIRRGR